MTHTPASAPRGRPILRDATRAQPLQPALRCRHRHTKRRRDLLAAEASRLHALRGETLLCGSHHVSVRMPENTRDLEGNVACGVWICHRVGRCASSGKTCCFMINFDNGGHFRSKGVRKLMFFTLISGLSSFRREFLGKMESGCLKHREKRSSKLRGPMQAAHPARLGTSSQKSAVAP